MITGLAHIGIAVTDLDKAVALWTCATGGKVIHRETVPGQKVNVAVIAIGELHVELLCATAEDSPIAKFITARGTGIHHLALACTTAQAELDRMKAEGIRLIDETARPGAEGTRVGFIHPKALEGVLVEIVEPDSHL